MQAMGIKTYIYKYIEDHLRSSAGILIYCYYIVEDKG